MQGKRSNTDFNPRSQKKEKTKLAKRPSRFSNKKTAQLSETVNPLNGKRYSQRYFKILKRRMELPAFETKSDFVKTVMDHDIVIVQGETGSGKTTQLPQFLIEEFGKSGKLIGVTQPRRVAAISVAKRVSEETDTLLGSTVGYAVRFDEKSSERTRLKYMTDGMLLRESMRDQSLWRYSVVILDEAHERTLNSDILLAMLKKLVNQRREGSVENRLKLIVMSATIEVDRFVKYFEEEVPVLSIPGRCFPVEIYYTPEPEEDYLEAAVRTAVQIHCFEAVGDVLVFLTGEAEILEAVDKTASQIREMGAEVGPVMVLPLFSAMTNANQQKIFGKAPESPNEDLPGRKIIFSTNIAETSLTIDGIVYVIDPGLSKQKVYNPRLKIESLLVAPISKASAKQRAGRAGRTRPGKCYRLYTEDSYKSDLEDFTISEILRSDLCSTLLTLKSLNVENIIKFDFIEPPSPETMFRALDHLVHLDVMDSKGELTSLGKIMSFFPLEPKYTKVLLAAAKNGCLSQALDVIAVLNCGNWRIRGKTNTYLADAAHKKFYDPYGCDLATVAGAFEQYESAKDKRGFCHRNFLNSRTLSAAVNVKRQLARILNRLPAHGISIDFNPRHDNQAAAGDALRKSFFQGFYHNVAHLQSSGTYQVLRENHMVLVHPSSAMKRKPEFLMYLEFVLTSKNFLRMVSPLKAEWLPQMFPKFYAPGQISNPNTKRILQKLFEKQARQKRMDN